MSLLTRRSLVRSALAITATSLAGSAALFAQSETSTQDTIDEGALEANAAVATALAEATARVASFNYYGLGEISTLIANVTTAQTLAASLAETETPYLRLHWPEQTARVLQLARNYVASLGGPSNPGALCAIRDGMIVARQDLSAQADGKGVPAAILLTLAFAAEFGAARRLTNDRETLRALLDDYRVWTDAMRNMADGSIPFRRVAATTSHNSELSALAESPYGKRLGIGTYLIEGAQIENRIADPCVIFYSRYLENPAQTRGGFTVPDDHRLNHFWNPTLVPWVLVGYSRIKARDNAQFGVRLIEFSPGEGKPIPTSGIIGGLRPPIGGEFCYAISSRGVGTSGQAIAQADDHPSLKEDRKDRSSIIAAIKNANACRIEIALCGRALGMLGRFDRVREFFEREV